MHKHGLIGAPVSRVDGPLKVQGKARFAAEVAMERLTYAALVHSTIARGRIVRISTAAAEGELADAAGLRDNGFKIELAKRTIAAVLGELAGEKA